MAHPHPGPLSDDESDSELDALIPSFPGSPRFLSWRSCISSESETSFTSHTVTGHHTEKQDYENPDYDRAVEFLQSDNELFLACELGDNDRIAKLIRFTCCSYDGQMEHINVNEVRKDLFASKNKLVISLPPRSAALYKHALRAAYQAGHIWGNALKPDVSIPRPSSWGWTKEKESWTPEWSAVTAIWSQLSLLDHCGCKSGCETMRCGCRRVSLPCTAQCKSCIGGCTNQKQGVNVNIRDTVGRTALHFAVHDSNMIGIKMLLEAGASPLVMDNVGLTPLQICIMRRPSVEVAKVLFSYGAVILPRVKTLSTGLFLQFTMMVLPTDEEMELLALLLEHGALINDPYVPGGRSPLHFAAMSNNCKLIRVLVNLGANIHAKNHRGETPFDVAVTFQCTNAIECLKELTNDSKTSGSSSRRTSNEQERGSNSSNNKLMFDG